VQIHTMFVFSYSCSPTKCFADLLLVLYSTGSSGHVSFSGLQSGLYVLKVHAFNRREDVSTIKRGFVISSDPFYCSLVLINRGVVLSQNNSIATVEVKVQGPARQLSCMLDNGEPFQCKYSEGFYLITV